MTARQRTHWIICCSTLVAGIWLLHGRSLHADDKPPIPSGAALDEALKLVKDVYGDEHAKAASSEEKTAFAEKLLQTAKGTNQGTANHYALLRVAWDVATQAGDAKMALQITDQIAGVYEVNALSAKVATVKTTVGFVRTSTQNTSLSTVALEVVDEAVAGDDYGSAAELTEIALAAARKARDWQLVKQIAARDKTVKEMAEAHAKAQEALATLESNPTDPAANQAAGEYFCFVKGDWQKGIPMLALGSDEALRSLAQKDLRGAGSPNEQLELADRWWELAQMHEGQRRETLLLRAGSWYGEAKAGLSSALTLAKVEKRLEEIERIGRPAPKPSTESKSRRRTRPEPHYLTTMEEIEVKMGPWPLGKGRSGTTPIVVNGVACKFGLGVHPPSRGFSSVKYQLGKKFRRLITGAALVIGKHTSRSAITFVVVGDGEVLWMSRPTQAEQVQICDVSVADVDILELRVQCPGDNHLAQACWLDPYVIESLR